MGADAAHADARGHMILLSGFEPSHIGCPGVCRGGWAGTAMALAAEALADRSATAEAAAGAGRARPIVVEAGGGVSRAGPNGRLTEFQHRTHIFIWCLNDPRLFILWLFTDDKS